MALIKEGELLVLLHKGKQPADIHVSLISTPKVSGANKRYQTFMVFNERDELLFVITRTEDGVMSNWGTSMPMPEYEIVYKDDQIFWAMCAYYRDSNSMALGLLPIAAKTKEEMEEKLSSIKGDYIVVLRGISSRQELLQRLDKAKRT